jgi:hypothetical protein
MMVGVNGVNWKWPFLRTPCALLDKITRAHETEYFRLGGMKGWIGYLLWEGIPFLLLLSVFGFISVINWDYESKLISPDNGASDWAGVHLGLILLAMATGFALAASLILFLVRVFQPKPNSGWFMIISLGLVTLFLIFPSLFIVMFGPAAITMMEQERVMPK